MDMFLTFFVGFYMIFGFISCFIVYLSADYFEMGLTTWKGFFNFIFAYEIVVYDAIKDSINNVGIAIIMTLWSVFCLPINIIVFCVALFGEIIRGIVIVFLKLFGRK